jgi:hypothetical protein
MDYREYLITSNEWANNIPDKIWWQVHEKAINSIGVNKRRYIQQFIHKKSA